MHELEPDLLASAVDLLSDAAKHIAPLMRAQKSPKRHVAGLRECGEALVVVGALLSRRAGEIDGEFVDLGPKAHACSLPPRGEVHL
ncbi:hypothetical protein AB0N89_00865 [Amycolatopsis sp. NPDC089917]|uniref:hypothetical protein n=1 Tax=Amycolatopsis sp. NPDC089917 TaxID=3155187 RepID=UPI003442466C